jgi:hypothetical protein
MKKALLLLCAMSIPIWAQVSNPGVVYVTTDPSGSCRQGSIAQINQLSGDISTCGNVVAGTGTWLTISGGTGNGITALTTDVTATGPGSVAATVKGINGTLLSSLSTGLLKITTSTGAASTVPLAGSGAGVVTGPTTSVSGDVVTFTGTAGQAQDSGTLLSALAPLASPTFTGTPTLSGLPSGCVQLGCTIASTDLTGLTANVATTNVLYAVPVGKSGFYTAKCYTVLTTAAATSSTLPACLVRWTDAETSTLESIQFTNTSSVNTVGTVGINAAAGGTGILAIHPAASTNVICYTSSYASNTAAQMQFSQHCSLTLDHY